MNRTVVFPALLLLLLAAIAVAPAGAAAAASADACPSSCSCLLPEEAAKIGSPGSCGGFVRSCGADEQDVRKFCYEKPAVKPPAVLATMVVLATTTAARQACAAGCSCLSPEYGKANNLLYCSGKPTLCSGSPGQDPRYCFAPAAGVTLRTTTPAVAAIRPRVSLVAVPAGTAAGTPVLPAVSARILATTPVPAATTGAVPADTGIFAGIGSIFGSLLGTPSSGTPSRMISCNGTLTDVMADPANCGGCGQVCPDGPCVMGTCRDRSGRMTLPCGAMEVLCNGACTDIWFNASHCGNCTNTCGADEGCCSGLCVNLSSREHCGSCGNACRSGSSYCAGGTCLCSRPGNSLCPGNDCYNLGDNEDNCGACGHACSEDETCCNGACTDTAGNDRNNCGSCGRVCPETQICVNGACISTGTSETNCGGRGIACVAGETCCGGNCVNLNSPETCGTSCFDQVACAQGWVCCNGDCESEHSNCGTCGNECDFNEFCCNGACTLVDNNDRCGSCTRGCAWNEVCHKPPARFNYECISWWDHLWQ